MVIVVVVVLWLDEVSLDGEVMSMNMKEYGKNTEIIGGGTYVGQQTKVKIYLSYVE